MTWAWLALGVWIVLVVLVVLDERRRELEDPGVRKLRERKERDWNL